MRISLEVVVDWVVSWQLNWLNRAALSLSQTSMSRDLLKQVRITFDEFLERMVYDATGSDSKILHVKCDVSDVTSIKESGRIAREKFGPVTLLINNAGIVSGKSILDLSDFMMKKTLEVNTLAHLYTIREFLPDMIALN